MPNTKSAAKRLRQNLRRRDRNRSVKHALRTHCRKVREAATSGDVAKAQAEFQIAVVKLDRAATRKVIHANTAARTKSRLSAAVKAAKAAAKK